MIQQTFVHHIIYFHIIKPHVHYVFVNKTYYCLTQHGKLVHIIMIYYPICTLTTINVLYNSKHFGQEFDMELLKSISLTNTEITITEPRLITTITLDHGNTEYSDNT